MVAHEPFYSKTVSPLSKRIVEDRTYRFLESFEVLVRLLLAVLLPTPHRHDSPEYV